MPMMKRTSLMNLAFAASLRLAYQWIVVSDPCSVGYSLELRVRFSRRPHAALVFNQRRSEFYSISCGAARSINATHCAATASSRPRNRAPLPSWLSCRHRVREFPTIRPAASAWHFYSGPVSAALKKHCNRHSQFANRGPAAARKRSRPFRRSSGLCGGIGIGKQLANIAH